jgi:hypothetical protein
MGEKVTFNELTKIIEIDEAPDVNNEIFIDVKTDLYSDGKEDWVANENLRKFQFPIEAVGGNPLPGEKALGATFFLASDWKIRPYNSSHRLIINGNLYSEDGTDPFLDTIGTHTVRIMQQVSSLVDSTIQQLPEIEYASFNGGITVDAASSYSGTNYPVGTPQAPVNNLIDALAIAVDRGFTSFFIMGDITIDDSLSFEGMAFVGESQIKSTLTVETNADVEDCHFYDAHVTGVLDGGCKLKNCMITDLNYINGIIEQCLLEPGTIILGGSQEAHLVDCWSGAIGVSIPYIDMGSSGQDLIIRNYNGDIGIKNLSGSNGVSIDLNSGSVTLDNDLTNGTIKVRGVGNVIDNSSGASIDTDELVNPDNISNHVWQHINGMKILGLVQENYVMDQQIYDDYNGAKLLTSARIRTYQDSAKTQLIATYQVTATWSNGACTSYQMVIV